MKIKKSLNANEINQVSPFPWKFRFLYIGNCVKTESGTPQSITLMMYHCINVSWCPPLRFVWFRQI